MGNFWFFLEQGFFHVLDWSAYDHVLFFIVLAIPYSLKQWKSLLTLVTIFTIGHTLSLALAAFKIIQVNGSIIELLIPVTIIATAIANIFRNKTVVDPKTNWTHWVATAVFGIIHGFGFSTLFNMMTASATSKGFLLIAYTLGIEFAQLVIVSAIVLISLFTISIVGLKLRHWILIVSVLVIVRIIPILYDAFGALSI